jgi:hypothetical protein
MVASLYLLNNDLPPCTLSENQNTQFPSKKITDEIYEKLNKINNIDNAKKIRSQIINKFSKEGLFNFIIKIYKNYCETNFSIDEKDFIYITYIKKD